MEPSPSRHWIARGHAIAVPELPEVETIRRQLEPRLIGRRVVDAWAFASDKFTAAEGTPGAAIESVGRRGKYLLLALDDDRELVVHLGMTGSLRVTDRADDPGGPVVHLRATFDLDDGSRLEFRDVRRFGRIAVVPAGDHSSLPTLASCGPEPLGDAFTAAALHAALRRSTRAVKTQLLSQRPVAGVGNIYADEALWLAGVHPVARRLSRPRSAALRDAIREVIAEGIERGGTTLRDYVDAEGSAGTNQWHLRCYGRAGEPCERCATPLRRRVLDGRATTWCPACQRLR